MAKPWILTIDGHKFPLLDTRPEQINFRVVAEVLAKIPRFGGHVTGGVYSVAQHCVLVSNLAALSTDGDYITSRRRALIGLIHDAHEAYIGDITTPVQRAVAQIAGSDPIAALKVQLDRAIYQASGLDYPLKQSDSAAVHAADKVALATERRDLLADGPAWDEPLPPPVQGRIRPWAWHLAMDEWLKLFSDLTAGPTNAPNIDPALIAEVA